MGFLANLFNRPPKTDVYDLLYLYMRLGSPWGSQELTWNMKNCFDNHNFSKQWDRIVALGLVEPAKSADRLEYATNDDLRLAAKKYGLKTSLRKNELVEALIESGHGDDVASALPRVVGATDLGKALLAKHDYIPYVVKRCKDIPCGYEKMFAKRERDESSNKYEIVLFGLNEEAFYTDSCYDEEDKAYARDCRKEAKGEYRDFVKSVASDAKADGIAIDVSRYLN